MKTATVVINMYAWMCQHSNSYASWKLSYNLSKKHCKMHQTRFLHQLTSVSLYINWRLIILCCTKLTLVLRFVKLVLKIAGRRFAVPWTFAGWHVTLTHDPQTCEPNISHCQQMTLIADDNGCSNMSMLGYMAIGLPCYCYVTATVWGKQVPACVTQYSI